MAGVRSEGGGLEGLGVGGRFHELPQCGFKRTKVLRIGAGTENSGLLATERLTRCDENRRRRRERRGEDGIRSVLVAEASV